MNLKSIRSVMLALLLGLLANRPANAVVRTATPTPTPEPQGCCQAEPASRTGVPICGNQIKRSDCTAAFGSRARFCENCDCTSHSGPGFTFDRGVCAEPAPVTPSLTPTATTTPTPVVRQGCCQVNTSRPGPHPFVCGNGIDQDSCLNDFGAGATFCADCVCSSHSGPGFGNGSGTCLRPGGGSRPRPTRPPRPPRPTRPPR